MEVRLSFAPWLPLMLDIMTRMMIIGYRIDKVDFGRMIEEAVVVEVG